MTAIKTKRGPADATRLGDGAALRELVRRLIAKNDTLRVEPLPDPRDWAILPDHVTDRDYFEELCFHVFAAGFSRDVVRKKWPATRAAFRGFELPEVARLRATTLAKLVKDTALIRNRRKLDSVVHNAKAILALAGEHGSWSAWLQGFDRRNLYLLHKELAQRFACVGPSAGEWFLLTSGFPYYFATDHARRVLARIGLTSRVKPTAIELNEVLLALAKASGESSWRISAELFLFGSGFHVTEAICRDGIPRCPKCPLWDHCDHFNQSRS